ncbi:MAG TPA: hypothetical protein VIP11_10070 [Gemmatimonadaceae bacterium]
MRMMRCGGVLGLLVATMAPLSTLTGQADERPTMRDIRGWIGDHHPDLYGRDTTSNLLYIVVDTNKNYVRSITARAGEAEAASAAAAMRRFLELNDDSLMTACVSETAPVKPPARPLCIVDGARVRTLSTVQLLSASGFELLRGADARTKFGGDGANGAVVLTTIPARAARFKKLGLGNDSVDNMMHLSLRAGVIGQMPLNVFVLFLAAGKR